MPWQVPADAWEQAWETAMVEAGYDPFEDQIYEPDLWLVASPDGIEWLVEDLADDYFAHSAAINGDVVIVGGDDGWTRYTLS